MEKRKVSLSTFIIIVGIIVIGVLACYLVVLTQKEADAKAQVANLEKSVQEIQTQLQTVQNEKNNLQQKVDAVTNVVGGNNTQTTEKNTANTTSKNDGIKIEKDEFSLTLPKSWEGKYEIKRYDIETDIIRYEFVSTVNAKAGVSGEIFSICFLPKDLNDYSQLSAIAYKMIETNGDYYVMVEIPADVSDTEVTKEGRKEYEGMAKDVDSIINTIVIKQLVH